MVGRLLLAAMIAGAVLVLPLAGSTAAAAPDEQRGGHGHGGHGTPVGIVGPNGAATWGFAHGIRPWGFGPRAWGLGAPWVAPLVAPAVFPVPYAVPAAFAVPAPYAVPVPQAVPVPVAVPQPVAIPQYVPAPMVAPAATTTGCGCPTQ